MSADVAVRPQAPSQEPPEPDLHSSHVPLWAWLTIIVAAAGVTGLLSLATSLRGTAQNIALFLLVAVFAVTGASARIEGGRKARNRLMTGAMSSCFLLAMLPLLSLLVFVVEKGSKRLDVAFFTKDLTGVGPLSNGGGASNAIIGTLEQVGLTTLISVPIGLLVAIYITEYGGGRFATVVQFLVDVMTGIPSIVAGLFILAFWVLALGLGVSGFAGSLALSILMIPIIVRSSEEMFRLVPNDLREAAYALGVPRWRTILSIVLPTALTGIITGITLAIARVAGETAPVLFTVGFSNFFNNNPFAGDQASLPFFVYQNAVSSRQNDIDRAWSGALTLILIVLLLNLVARALARRNTLARR